MASPSLAPPGRPFNAEAEGSASIQVLEDQYQPHNALLTNEQHPQQPIRDTDPTARTVVGREPVHVPGQPHLSTPVQDDTLDSNRHYAFQETPWYGSTNTQSYPSTTAGGHPPYVVAVEEQHQPFGDQVKETLKKYKKPLAVAIALPVTLVVLAALIVALVVTQDRCTNRESPVFSNDIRVITDTHDLKLCGSNPKIFTQNSDPDDLQIVHVYESDCEELKWHDGTFSEPTKTYSDRSDPLEIFNLLLTEGGNFTLSLNITAFNTLLEVYVCLFDNVREYKDRFDGNPDDWMNAIRYAIRCTPYNVTHQTLSLSETYSVPRTGYYIVAVASTKQINSIQFSYEWYTKYLDHNDYRGSELDCSNGCTPNSTCAIAYAEPDFNEEEFSFVDTKRPTFTTSRIAAIVVGCVALIVCVLSCLVGVLWCRLIYNR